MAHYECKYCDSPFPPVQIDDELVCRCGAEWEDAKVLVEDEDHDLGMDDDDDFWFDDDIVDDDDWDIDYFHEDIDEEEEQG